MQKYEFIHRKWKRRNPESFVWTYDQSFGEWISLLAEDVPECSHNGSDNEDEEKNNDNTESEKCLKFSVHFLALGVLA